MGLIIRAFVFVVLTTSHFIASTNAVYTWPNPTMDELEHILVDNQGFNDARFKRAIIPCTDYIQGPQTLGRQTSAQWLRVAFHDFSTANVAAGTGGIDASIGFETLRPENSGSAMNDSLSFFAPFVNAHVSMADLIALSVSLSIGSCSSPTITIPLRGGRIDATEGGEFGVPEPETSIEETLGQFEHAGFNQVDAIGLTACGHTMGSVHHGGFPQVVPESAVTPNNTGGGIHFDSTPDVFDINVVTDYLSGQGNRGGALVTTDNVTVRSDLRIYASDNNATMRDLSTSSEHFISTCIMLFTRMMETVPKTVTLTDIIAPLQVKPVNVTLDFTPTGTEMRFRGFVRLLTSDSSSHTPEVLLLFPKILYIG
ncbi:heme peroxidase [Marasmius fiardii PR-910]|nr:heme peroxidase [Marasmius fiardii PR-910]